MFWILGLVLAQEIPGLPGRPDIGSPPAITTKSSLEEGQPVIVKLPEEELNACNKKVDEALANFIKELDEVKVDCPSKSEVFRRNVFQRKNKRQLDKKADCIPLVSEDISANPYHENLIGVDPNTVVTRSGVGRPFFLDGEIDTANTNGIDWAMTRSVSFTKSTMIGITLSDGTTNTKVNGTSWTNANTNSVQNSINNVIEKSNTSSLLNEKNENLVKDIQTQLTNTVDKQLSEVTNWNKEDSDSNAETWNRQDGETNTKDSSKDIAIQKGTINTNGWDRQNEHSNSEENSKSISVTCTFTKTKSDARTTTHEINVELRGEITVGVEGEVKSGIPIVAEGKGTARASATVGLSGGYRYTWSSTLTDEDSKTLTFTISATNTKSDMKAARCGTNGNKQDYDLTTETSHENTQYGTTVNKDKGGSKTKTINRSEGGSNEKRTSDSIAKAFTNSDSNSTGWSIGKTDTYGSTLVSGITNTSDYSFSASTGGDFSNSVAVTKNVDITNQTTDSTTWEVSRSITGKIPGNACVRPVCYPKIVSTVLPWACKSEDVDDYGDPIIDIITTELQQRVSEKPGQIQDVNFMDCNFKFLPCFQTRKFENNKLPIYLSDFVYDSSQGIQTDKDLAVGKYTAHTQYADDKIRYYFGWGKNNDFGVYSISSSSNTPASSDTQIWSSGVKLMASFSDNVVADGYARVTQNGHLEVRARGLFDIISPDTEIVVWSNLPGYMNHTVGIFGNRYENDNFGYKLRINENGVVELYDSVYVRIWSNNNNRKSGNRHAYGYKFPVHVPYPLLAPIPLNEPCYPEINPRTYIPIRDQNYAKPKNVKWLGNALNYGTIMNQNEGIISENGRFQLYLSSSPNLIIKEGCRTMWESYTAKPWQGIAPYFLAISTSGRIVMKDFNRRVIWGTDGHKGVIKKVVVSNTGVLQGLDINNVTIWQSRNDDPEIPGRHIAYATPIVEFDDASELHIEPLENFPLVNVYTNKCIAVNDTDATVYTKDVSINKNNFTIDYSMCQMFNLNPINYMYTLSGTLSKCLSHGKIEICGVNTMWRHYNDGLFTNMNTGICLGSNAQPIDCKYQTMRADKLWSRGVYGISEFGTNSTNMLMKGTMFVQKNVWFRYHVNNNNDLIFEAWDRNKETDIKYYMYNTRVRSKEITVLKLLEIGFVSNVTQIIQKDGTKFQKGVPPYFAKIDSKGLRIMDSKNQMKWVWWF